MLNIMKNLKSLLLLGLFVTITYVSQGSSIGKSNETPLNAIFESNFRLADGTTTTRTTTTRTTTTTTRGQRLLQEVI